MKISQTRSKYIVSYNNLFVRLFMQGLLPILPIISIQLKATKFQGGLLLSVLFSFMLIGTLLAGKIGTSSFDARKVILICSLPLSISLAMIGYVENFKSLLVDSIILGFCSGMFIMTFFIYLGKVSEQKDITKNFSFVAFSNQLATVVGGLFIGFLISKIGQTKSFLIFGLLILINSLSVLILPGVAGHTQNTPQKFVFTKKYTLLLIAALLTIMCIHIFNLSFSLKLAANNISVTKIAYYSSLGTGVMLWFPLFLGIKTNYKHSNATLLFCSLSIIAAFALLRYANSDFAYIISIAIMSIMTYPFFIPVMQKIFNWYPKNEMPMAQSFYTGVAWLSAILGYLISGIILQFANLDLNVMIASLFAIVSIIVILNVKDNESLKAE